MEDVRIELQSIYNLYMFNRRAMSCLGRGSAQRGDVKQKTPLRIAMPSLVAWMPLVGINDGIFLAVCLS